MKQHITYRNFIKRAMAQYNESAVYAKPGKAGKQEARAVEPVAVVADVVTIVESEPVTVAAVVEPEPVKVETVEPVAVVEPVKVEFPFWKPEPGEGVALKGDKFQIVTLTSDVYNGKRIPFPTGTVYPVYMVGNQDGALLQTVRNDDPEMLGWHYRPAGYYGSSEEAMKAALKDLKALKTWQRKTYGTGSKQKADSITLPARGTLESFEVVTKSLLAVIRGYSQKVYMELGDYLFPVKPLAEMCRVADGETMAVTVVKEHVTTCKKDKNRVDSETYTKTTPALVIRHGNSKTTFLGMLKGENIPANIEIIPAVL